MLALELASARLNGGYAIGLALRKRWAWPLGFLGTMLGILVMFHAKLYAESVLNLGYAGLAVAGWLSWQKPLCPMTSFTRVRDIAVATVLALCVGVIMLRFTDNPRPMVAAVLLSGGILGTAWQVWGDRWNWPLWIAVNAASTWLYVDRDLNAYAVYAAFMTAIAVWGWRQWGAKSE